MLRANRALGAHRVKVMQGRALSARVMIQAVGVGFVCSVRHLGVVQRRFGYVLGFKDFAVLSPTAGIATTIDFYADALAVSGALTRSLADTAVTVPSTVGNTGFGCVVCSSREPREAQTQQSSCQNH